jgi:hypothetical protein
MVLALKILVTVKSMKYVNLLMADVGWWIIYAMVAPVMLVRVKLLLVVLAICLVLIGVLVTVGIRLLEHCMLMVVMPPIFVLTPPLVVTFTTGKQQCNMPLPITTPLIPAPLLILMTIFAPPVGMCQPETPVVSL